jgi:hypothetical protein
MQQADSVVGECRREAEGRLQTVCRWAFLPERNEWDGTGRTGKGNLEIIDTVPLFAVTMNLHMLKPMECNNTIVFALHAKGGDTSDVSWTMTGAFRYLNKVMGVVFNMDRMVGGEFEKGLADLKQLAER